MYSQHRSYLAFSLIELAVVLVIMGVLTTAISGGAKILIRRAKILRIQQLTGESPVYRIHELNNSLMIWYETALADSLQLNSNNQVASLINRNPTISTDLNAHLQNPLKAAKLLTSTSIKGIPLVSFPTAGTAFTITADSLRIYRPLNMLMVFAYRPSTTSQQLIQLLNSSITISSDGKLEGRPLITNQFYILNLQCDISNCSLKIIGRDSQHLVNNFIGSSPEILDSVTIGSNGKINSYFAEFILFRGNLSAEEQQTIIDYLQQKWLN